jgi:hypothetical protein
MVSKAIFQNEAVIARLGRFDQAEAISLNKSRVLILDAANNIKGDCFGLRPRNDRFFRENGFAPCF